MRRPSSLFNSYSRDQKITTTISPIVFLDSSLYSMRSWAGKEKAWGQEHMSTLNTVNNLGLLYADQGKMAEAEEMYMRALRGYEKAWGLEHTSTLSPVNNLGLLYADQGKMVEAEKMYQRALEGYERLRVPTHPSTKGIRRNLSSLGT